MTVKLKKNPTSTHKSFYNVNSEKVNKLTKEYLELKESLFDSCSLSETITNSQHDGIFTTRT